MTPDAEMRVAVVTPGAGTWGKNGRSGLETREDHTQKQTTPSKGSQKGGSEMFVNRCSEKMY